MRPFLLVLVLATAGCGAVSVGGSTPTRHRVGDRIVYRYAGESLAEPVELEERITEVDGARLRIAVTATRDCVTRRWIQVVTDGGDGTSDVDRLYGVDEDGTEHLLENEDGEDLHELYEWTLPDVEFGDPGAETTTTEERSFAGQTWRCAISRSPLPSIGEHASIELSDCDALVWTHGPGRIVDGDRTLWSVDVVEVTTPPPAP